MIKAKVLAMCVCPAVATPPAVLAVHPPARHAVAHLLHRAANRLDRGSVARAAAPPPSVAANLPCAPSLASGGGALPVGGDLGGPLAGGDLGGGTLGDVAGVPAGGVPGSGGGLAYGGGGAPGGGGLAYGGGPGSGLGSGGVPGGIGPAGGAPAAPISGGTGAGATQPSGMPPTGHMTWPVSAPVGQVSGAPEPAAWALLVIGFGTVGMIARSGRARAADA